MIIKLIAISFVGKYYWMEIEFSRIRTDVMIHEISDEYLRNDYE